MTETGKTKRIIEINSATVVYLKLVAKYCGIEGVYKLNKDEILGKCKEFGDHFYISLIESRDGEAFLIQESLEQMMQIAKLRSKLFIMTDLQGFFLPSSSIITRFWIGPETKVVHPR